MPRQRKRHVQQEIDFKTWGGKRKGAGRPAKGARPSEPHKTRDDLKAGTVALVTMRVVPTAGNLRRAIGYHAVRYALYVALARDNFRIAHVSIQRTHLHLIVEADSKAALARGLQSFEISVAKRLNRAIVVAGEQRRGAVFADRYHVRRLSTPRQVRNALAYVLNNWRRHGEDRDRPTRKVDPYSSGVCFPGWRELDSSPTLYAIPDGFSRLSVAIPQTWLLRVGWMKAGTISVHQIPGPATKRAAFAR